MDEKKSEHILNESDDRCCCNCVNRSILRSHPCVDGESMKNQIGWVCVYFHMIGNGCVILSNEHGICEGHSFKDISL